MYYIVGLGNPHKEHANTRHNVGFLVAEAFVKEVGFPSFHESSALGGFVSEGVYEGKEVTVLLPQTFMNASGSSVAKLVPTQQASNLLLIYDEINIPLGEVKVSFGRGDGGHNGVKSVIGSLKTKEFARLRVGIAHKSMWTGKTVRPQGEKLSNYVLGNFSAREQKQLQTMYDSLSHIIKTFVTDGVETTMNRFN